MRQTIVFRIAAAADSFLIGLRFATPEALPPNLEEAATAFALMLWAFSFVLLAALSFFLLLRVLLSGVTEASAFRTEEAASSAAS